jgi:hypothetical protein
MSINGPSCVLITTWRLPRGPRAPWSWTHRSIFRLGPAKLEHWSSGGEFPIPSRQGVSLEVQLDGLKISQRLRWPPDTRDSGGLLISHLLLGRLNYTSSLTVLTNTAKWSCEAAAGHSRHRTTTALCTGILADGRRRTEEKLNWFSKGLIGCGQTITLHISDQYILSSDVVLCDGLWRSHCNVLNNKMIFFLWQTFGPEKCR